MTIRPDDVALMTGSYATDAVDAVERAAVDAAMAASDPVRAEVDSLHETALLLAYAVEPVEPPRDLRAALMAKIATTPQLPALPVEDAQGGSSVGDLAAAAPGSAQSVAPQPVAREARHAAVTDVTAAPAGTASGTARVRWFQRPARVVLAAAAAVAVIAGGTLGIQSLAEHETGPGQGQVQASTKLDQIYAAADFQRASTTVKGGGTATVVWSDQLRKSAVIFKGVKAAPAGKTYELWYIGSSITPAGLVGSVDGGTTSAVLSGAKAAGDTIGITVEPAGGSKQPTTKPIVAVPTSA
ncbi:anti-sigma factor [Curtobacterium sp. MCBD17_028]|uniref:anti-sigma factor n=1 Tax=Curtobacterium sp. MCBD17_028 TaxID=2175670 RepID=UPI000DA8D30D|nr:anti-sigma factor [Curtobacterium sp. MCBD17_028]PZE27201.1 hypothetical protein DEI86_06780 [Curtobacterium sp. MCBD17_028]